MVSIFRFPLLHIFHKAACISSIFLMLEGFFFVVSSEVRLLDKETVDMSLQYSLSFTRSLSSLGI